MPGLIEDERRNSIFDKYKPKLNNKPTKHYLTREINKQEVSNLLRDIATVMKARKKQLKHWALVPAQLVISLMEMGRGGTVYVAQCSRNWYSTDGWEAVADSMQS